MSRICFGCGAKLQYSNKDSKGYVPENKLNDAKYCMRCFKLMHYGVNINDTVPKKVEEILYLVNSDNKHTIFMCDFLSLSDKIINIYNKIKGKKLLLISKIDVILKDIKIDTIRKYILNNYKVNSVRFVSSVNGYGIDSLINYLITNNIRESYILGETNSGKSTLINNILDAFDSKLTKTTISNSKNTTLDFIRLNINNNLTIIDSPGFVTDSYELNCPLKKVIKPLTYQMKDGEVLKIDKFYLKFSASTSITIYSAYDLDIKKYYKNDINFTYNKKIDSNSDIVIYGLGFINVKNECTICVSNIDSTLLEFRESVFK